VLDWGGKALDKGWRKLGNLQAKKGLASHLLTWRQKQTARGRIEV